MSVIFTVFCTEHLVLLYNLAILSYVLEFLTFVQIFRLVRGLYTVCNFFSYFVCDFGYFKQVAI